MGNLKVWKDSHSMLRNPQSNTWSVECGVLSIRHKFGAWTQRYTSDPADPQTRRHALTSDRLVGPAMRLCACINCKCSKQQ